MTDPEYDLLDELYFISSYPTIADSLRWEEKELINTLCVLYAKGWIRCYRSPEEEIPEEELNLVSEYRNYFYLASKKGLFAHNSTE